MESVFACQPGFGMERIIAQYSIFSIDILDDCYKTHIFNLVEITMRFGFYTLGCKVNQYETQAMEQLLADLGHEICSFEDSCDGYIINTCSVTAVADKKNRAVIRRCRKTRPDATIGVCGCYTQHAPEAAKALGVDVLGGSARREDFIRQMVESVSSRSFGEALDGVQFQNSGRKVY